MLQSLAAVTVLVPSYEDGLAFFRGILGFGVLEDSPLSPNKRWVVVAPVVGRRRGARGRRPERRASVGPCWRPDGGTDRLFLPSEDFWADHEELLGRGVSFLETPRREACGLVAVFVDPWGGKWDLPQPASTTQRSC